MYTGKLLHVRDSDSVFYFPHSGSLRFLLIQAPWLRPVVVTARTLIVRPGCLPCGSGDLWTLCGV